MIGTRILAAFAAFAAHGLAAQAGPASVDSPAPIDSVFLAAALDGQRLQLTMRGTSVTVLANATPAEDGCAALLTVQAPGSGRIWTRLLRWSELAWAGMTPQGTTMVSFFEEEGRLPADRVVFRPADPVRFGAELQRVAALCRGAPGEGKPVAIAGRAAARGCYFAALPVLQLHDFADSTAQPPRAMLSVLARETPEAELQVLVEHTHGNAGEAPEWGRTLVAFTFADPRLKDMGLAAARFALDGKALAAEHALATYGDTRVRITMDPFKAAASAAKSADFFSALAAGREASLTLLDGKGRPQAQLSFDVGPTLAAAREALSAAQWSCAAAAPPPVSAALWQPEG